MILHTYFLFISSLILGCVAAGVRGGFASLEIPRPVLQMLAAMIQVPEAMKLTPDQTSLSDAQLIALIEGAKSL